MHKFDLGLERLAGSDQTKGRENILGGKAAQTKGASTRMSVLQAQEMDQSLTMIDPNIWTVDIKTEKIKRGLGKNFE